MVPLAPSAFSARTAAVWVLAGPQTYLYSSTLPQKGQGGGRHDKMHKLETHFSQLVLEGGFHSIIITLHAWHRRLRFFSRGAAGVQHHRDYFEAQETRSGTGHLAEDERKDETRRLH